MKKITALLTCAMLILSTVITANAITFDSHQYMEAEDLQIATAQGEYETIEDGSASGGKYVKLKGINGEKWLANDFIRYYVPIYQNAVFNIKVGVKKTPTSGIAQLWFSDINSRVGQKMDLYSENEEIAEYNLGNQACNISSQRWFEFRADGKNAKSSGYDICIDYIILDFAENYETIVTGGEFPYLKKDAPVAQGDDPYAWEQVMEGGTGRSTHIAFHPTEKGLVFMGTDMGGLYRWENDTYTWTPIFDNLEKVKIDQYCGIDGLALDPNNPDILYVAAGRDDNKGEKARGSLVKSYDRGNTWVETGLRVMCGANQDFRHYGECIAVDPANSNNVWFCTLHEGIYKSNDGFKTWEPVQLPYTYEKWKVFPRQIVFDPTTKTENGCTRFYIGVVGEGVFVTEDSGVTWTKTACKTTDPMKLRISNDGTLVVGGMKGLEICKNGVWSDITPYPDGNPVQGLAISRNNSDYIIASWSKGPVGSYNEYVYYTLDGGKTWRMITDDMYRNHTVPRMEWGSLFAQVTDISIDPYDEGRVFMCGWSNFFMTENIFAENPVITNYTRGVEHGCITMLSAPSKGARLLVSSYDYRGSRFIDPTQYADTVMHPKEVNPPRTAYSESNPNFIVRIGKGTGVYSTNNGIDWKYLKSLPTKGEVSSVTVSSEVYPETGNYAIVYNSDSSPLYVTYDLGETWIAADGFTDVGVSKWSRAERLSADVDNPNVFYFLDSSMLYKSEDWGKTFKPITSFTNGWKNKTNGGDGIIGVSTTEHMYYSTSKGEIFKEIGNFTDVSDFSFGCKKEGSKYPALYVLGTKDDDWGIYRTNDLGKTWEQLYSDKNAARRVPLALAIAADRQQYGVIYVGTSGRGVFYGVPRDMENPFYECRDDEIKVMINLQLENFDVPPALINDRTMVPMRKIFEDVGADIQWDEETQTVTATRIKTNEFETTKTVVKLTIGSKKIYINGEEYEMDVEPVVINDRTLVPLRFISQALGAKVEWIGEQDLAKITL